MAVRAAEGKRLVVTPDRWRQSHRDLSRGARARDGARDAFPARRLPGRPSLRCRSRCAASRRMVRPDRSGATLSSPGVPRLRPARGSGRTRSRLLGAGGMGEVYRARDTELGRARSRSRSCRRVARGSDRRARLDKEARLLAALNHPHIAAIYGVEEADGVRGLVLELVEGVDAGGRLSAEGPLPLSRSAPHRDARSPTRWTRRTRKASSIAI